MWRFSKSTVSNMTKNICGEYLQNLKLELAAQIEILKTGLSKNANGVK